MSIAESEKIEALQDLARLTGHKYTITTDQHSPSTIAAIREFQRESKFPAADRTGILNEPTIQRIQQDTQLQVINGLAALGYRDIPTFQQAHGIQETGIAGPQTKHELFAAVNHIKHQLEQLGFADAQDNLRGAIAEFKHAHRHLGGAHDVAGHDTREALARAIKLAGTERNLDGIEEQYRTKVVHLAEQTVGQTNNSGAFGPVTDEQGNSIPWCSMYDSVTHRTAAAQVAGLPAESLPFTQGARERGEDAQTQYNAFYSADDIRSGSKPVRPGDSLVIARGDDKIHGHIEIVTSVEGDAKHGFTYNTIAGNGPGGKVCHEHLHSGDERLLGVVNEGKMFMAEMERHGLIKGEMVASNDISPHHHGHHHNHKELEAHSSGHPHHPIEEANRITHLQNHPKEQAELPSSPMEAALAKYHSQNGNEQVVAQAQTEPSLFTAALETVLAQAAAGGKVTIPEGQQSTVGTNITNSLVGASNTTFNTKTKTSSLAV